MADKSCANCVHSYKPKVLAGPPQSRECRKLPPVPTVMWLMTKAGPQLMGTTAAFPPVQDNWYCDLHSAIVKAN